VIGPDSNFESVRDAAQAYITKGWQVVPLAPRSKACIDEGWLRLVFKPTDFNPDDNIGIRSVGGLVDIDCDAAEVVAVAGAFMPATNAVYGRPSKPRSHLLYLSAFDKTISFKDQGTSAEKATLIEIRVNHQSMAPPSVHPNGEVLAWEGLLGDATGIDADVLLRSVRLTATAAMVARYYNPPGNRHDWGLALAGFLRHLGLSEDEAKKIFTEAGKWARDPEVAERLSCVRTTYARSDDDPLRGAKGLKDVMGSNAKTFTATLNKIWGSSSSAWILDDKGERIAAQNQENIKRALDKMEVELTYDIFAEKLYASWGGRRQVINDSYVERLWLHIDATYHFRPTLEFFRIVVEKLAHDNERHPVREYLNGLRWDGVPRVDTWLIKHARAADTQYVRAISALVLVGAVRRVRSPGCKFDEMLVLESEQGLLKSSALRALCPNEDWFSDDLPLNVDAKQVIERTLGKWIIEAAELSGLRASQAEHFKSMMSRPTDGPVRLAYARIPIERPRQFILVGTTNAHAYLTDSTGNRRFWPIRVEKFDVDGIVANREQLWAEAADREARGESHRLDPSLYQFAALQQERRRTDDAWENILSSAFSEEESHRFTSERVWEILGFPISQRGPTEQARVMLVMQRLGFRRMSVRDENKKVVKGWGRDQLTGTPKLPIEDQSSVTEEKG